jgi:D-alanine-D-alanine ligase
VSILDGKALPVVEIRPHDGWYDYHNKYTKGKTDYLAPAPIDEAVSELCQLYAERAFFALSCSVYGRVDFRLRDNTPYFLEVNTLPGMTSLSLVPMAAKAAGISFEELLQTIIKLSTNTKVEES